VASSHGDCGLSENEMNNQAEKIIFEPIREEDGPCLQVESSAVET